MKGIKHILLGIAIILIGASFIISTDSSMGGYGEVILLIIGLAQCIRGVKMDDWALDNGTILIYGCNGTDI